MRGNIRPCRSCNEARRSTGGLRDVILGKLQVGLGGTAVASFARLRILDSITQDHFRNYILYLPLLAISFSYQLGPSSVMSKPVDPETISNFLAEQRDEAPADIQHLYLTFEDLWERKLWHQLTDRLLEFYQSPESKSQQLAIYKTFIISFADKINQLKLVKLALTASEQCKGESTRLSASITQSDCYR